MPRRLGHRGMPRCTLSCLLATGLAGLVVSSPAAGQTAAPDPGAAPPAPGAQEQDAPAPTGGSTAFPAPRLTDVRCVSDCAGVRTARPGSLVRVRGRNFDGVDSVIFTGAPGEADDVSVGPIKVRRKSLDARVPRAAADGPVVVSNVDEMLSAPSPEPVQVVGRERAGAEPVDVDLVGHKAFFDSARKITLTYVVRESQPTPVSIDLVRATDGVPIRRWPARVVPAGVPQTLVWDGMAGGKVQREGRYEFRVYAQTQTGMRAVAAQAGSDGSSPSAFTFLRHKFPVRGVHQYGSGAAAFGGGRGHQGHDVFAECGTPLVAARGGTVKEKRYHGRAGNYLVVDGEETDVDYAYMHLRDPALVEKGDRVLTGQLIGYVGDTGRASGCHLHFEMWKGAWQEGGEVFDPLPELQSWDKES
jgi:murein DD-endopeptidase MepM/ murein hydrolase activator NlpD